MVLIESVLLILGILSHNDSSLSHSERINRSKQINPVHNLVEHPRGLDQGLEKCSVRKITGGKLSYTHRVDDFRERLFDLMVYLMVPRGENIVELQVKLLAAL